MDHLKQARDVGEIVNAIIVLCKPYGDIRNWRFSRLPERKVLGFFIRLENPARHGDIASALGGVVVADEVYFEIRMQPVLVGREDDMRDGGFDRPAGAERPAAAMPYH